MPNLTDIYHVAMAGEYTDAQIWAAKLLMAKVLLWFCAVCAVAFIIRVLGRQR